MSLVVRFRDIQNWRASPACRGIGMLTRSACNTSCISNRTHCSLTCTKPHAPFLMEADESRSSRHSRCSRPRLDSPERAERLSSSFSRLGHELASDTALNSVQHFQSSSSKCLARRGDCQPAHTPACDRHPARASHPPYPASLH